MPTKKSAKKIVSKKAVKKPAAKKTAKRAMPSFAKASPALVAQFGQIMSGLPMAEPRRMFGYPAGFANGMMFASLFGNNLILRLPESERAAFIARYHSHLFEPVPGRPMREYVWVPPALLKTGAELDGWLSKAIAYAQSLPPKAKKK